MADATASSRVTLLVLASTYPRWKGDPEPGFVHELAKRMAGQFRVLALVPSAPDALPEESMDGVQIRRFRYAPRCFETLVNNGGMLANLRQDRWKWFLVPGFGLSMLWSAWRLSRRECVDVVHAHWLIPQGLVAALLSLVPGRRQSFVVTSHGADLYSLRGRLFRVLKGFVARRANAITVVSQAMRNELEGMGLDTTRVRIQPMGVDLVERFRPDADAERSRDEILFVGRLVEKKGLRHLIDAMPEILVSRPNSVLRIVGFGPEEAERREQVRRLGLQPNVQFLGAIEQRDLPALYRRAAVFVAPFVQTASGDQEGLGLVVVEAVGCGCPIVVSDLPSVRDIFCVHAPAETVKPGDPKSLAKAVCRVLESPRDTSVLRAGLVDRFDWRSVARDYSEIVERVAAGKARA